MRTNSGLRLPISSLVAATSESVGSVLDHDTRWRRRPTQQTTSCGEGRHVGSRSRSDRKCH
ncbi:hypothetical protein D8Y22_01595 [Salinadaptatus halalkaliphilus]|uniref:Uncharacterized protein n=1 Tax=Salinadaptatus halalkaliphilus TaxID=2419781 RepID=A0A4S3TSX3_9EURY|nr:hypothetical protein D8Y22_01595 [Salinadaptatus halalkaliphilus]